MLGNIEKRFEWPLAGKALDKCRPPSQAGLCYSDPMNRETGALRVALVSV
jgi:hypothetical protein